MSVDAYTKAVLSLIAVSLALLAARAWVEPAWAQSMECRIDGPIEIRDFADTLEVRVTSPLEIRPYSASEPGSSSAWPLYVKMAN